MDETHFSDTLKKHIRKSLPKSAFSSRHVSDADERLAFTDERICRILEKAGIHEEKITESKQVPDEVPTVLRKHLRSVGPVVFPSREVADAAWEFGLLEELPSTLVELLIQIIAERAYKQIPSVSRAVPLVIVCFGYPIHRCGKRLAAKLIERKQIEAHVVLAENFYRLRLCCNPRELKASTVLILVDVVHTGGLVHRLATLCERQQPGQLLCMAVIDQARHSDRKRLINALWSEEPRPRMRLEEYCASSARRTHTLRFYDPEAGRAYTEGSLPSEIADKDTARETVERQIKPLMPHLARANALQADKLIGGLHYPWVIDLNALLNNAEARRFLVQNAKRCLAGIKSRGTWCLVYPAERYLRAGQWARLLGRALGLPVVPVGLKTRKHFRPLKETQKRRLERYQGAVVVDAAIRTGNTLRSFVEILRSDGDPAVNRLCGFYVFDGLFDGNRDVLKKELGVEIRSLFQLPLSPPIQPIGQYCRERLGSTLEQVRKVDMLAQPRWVAVVNDYCEKRLTKPRWHVVRDQNPETNLQLAIEEWERGPQARLERSGIEGKSSILKQLDVQFALHEPKTRMVLSGFLCNSMPDDFIEWCALALASQNEYEWLDMDWLLLHQEMLARPKSRRWEFLACVLYWMKSQGDVGTVERTRHALQEFVARRGTQTLSLFPDSMDLGQRVDDSLDARCRCLISILT
jgi:hypothetical protein